MKNEQKLTPMMQQYIETKKEYPDCILFFRLGDFYEMFFEDALLASKELEIALTSKSCGLEEKAPMCGVPYHAVDGYLSRLIEKGYKVAIGEQVDDPKTTKGLLRREVVRIVTPGTTLDLGALDESKNNYLMCIIYVANVYAVSIADVSTGELLVTEILDQRMLYDEIDRYSPREIICNESLYISGVDFNTIKEQYQTHVSALDDHYFDESAYTSALVQQFSEKQLQTMRDSGMDTVCLSAGVMLLYLFDTQKQVLSQFTHITPYKTSAFMLLDRATRRNLELTETLREKRKTGSLLWVLDKTKTAMGARHLRKMIESPLISKLQIEHRYDAIEELVKSAMTRDELREYLGPIYDIERLMTRISNGYANPRDLLAFRGSIEMLPPIKYLLQEMGSPLLQDLFEQLDPLIDLYELIETSIHPEAPLSIRDGGLIRDGYHDEVDHIRKAKTEGKDWLAKLEEEERDKTGIKNLRIKYNKVFGYYLEVTNSQKDLVPEYYIRKQTLANAERYITPALKDLEDTILGAEDRLYTLEYELYLEIRNTIALEVKRVQQTAGVVATLDVLTSLAYVAEQNHYCRPQINENGKIHLVEGRHPVVERIVPHNMYIHNDTYLDDKKQRIAILTGPNMAGKSTYMRQVALIVLMAQIGSFVPCKSAKIGIVDRIFTRVGASDDLASGQSTFMVEMSEVANILQHATKKSLLIFDEIGRGTSTFDGLSIAWSVVEYIADKKLVGAKSLFATHYHELTELEGKIDGVNNYCIAVKENGDDIVFLRKIVKGGADQSYGIQVAKLAGVPDPVIQRAKEIVRELSASDITKRVAGLTESIGSKKTSITFSELDLAQMSLFDTTKDGDVVEELKNIDISHLTPIDAINTLYQLQNKLKNRW